MVKNLLKLVDFCPPEGAVNHQTNLQPFTVDLLLLHQLEPLWILSVSVWICSGIPTEGSWKSRVFLCGIVVLVIPGKVIGLEFISQLFAALLLLLSTLFTLLPVGPCRNIQNRLAGQNLPTDKRYVNEIQQYLTFSGSSKSLVPRKAHVSRRRKTSCFSTKLQKHCKLQQTSAELLTVQTAKGNVSGCGNRVSLLSPTPQRSRASLEGQSGHTHTHFKSEHVIE